MAVGPDLWYAALASEYGVAIITDDPEYLKQKLYAIRKRLADPDLELINIMTSPAGSHEVGHHEIWLVKRAKE